MPNLSTIRPILLGLLSTVLAVPALANADCANESLSPPERNIACEAALNTVTDPTEKARLLILRAQSNRQQITFDAVTNKSLIDLTEAERIISNMSPQMRNAFHAERGLLIMRAQSDRPEIKIDATSKARGDLVEAERLAPNMSPRMRADLLVERAEIYRLSNNRTAAFSQLDEAERLAPDAANPVISRSLLLLDQGKGDESFRQITKALKLEPNNVRALYHAMRQAQFTANVSACIEYGTRALAVSPRDTRVFAMRARCMADAGRVVDMEADVRKVEEIGPWAAVVLNDIAQAFLVLDRPEEAAIAARRAIRMDPTFQDAYFDLATALMATGAYEEVLAIFRGLNKAGVKDRIGLANNIAWELYLAARYDDGLQVINDWFTANPKPVDEPNSIANAQGYPVVVDTAAHILAALGRKDEAVASFMRAAKMSPGQFRIKYEERLAALGFDTKGGDDAGLEAALYACATTGVNCRLYGDDRRK